MKSITRLPNSVIRAAMIGFLTGVIWFVLFRTLAFQVKATHYHANFALYVNGQRTDFDNFTFYEEVEACSADSISAKARAHMHDEVSDVVHVHDEAVTWGHFFANLGFGLGNDYIRTDDDVLVDGSGGSLSFILNGQSTRLIANEIIGNEDRLLISFGNESEQQLQARYQQIAQSAGRYNAEADPAACGGSEDTSFLDRLRAVTGF